jgi:hypothetical protein
MWVCYALIMKKQHLGTLKTNPRDLTKAQGHAYGAGRSTQVLRHKTSRRSKDRLRKELQHD